MNKSNAADYLPLIQAMADGKTVQELYRKAEVDEWRDTESIVEAINPDFYRIKPEPREIWVLEDPNDGQIAIDCSLASENDATKQGKDGVFSRPVRFREVTE